MTEQIVLVDPFDLQPHGVNESIYQDAPDEEFIESIRQLGILEPILAFQPSAGIQSDGGLIVNPMVVLSGHRRMNAARLLDMEQVPVIIREEIDSDDEAIQLLILSNRQRDKTNEQRTREYSVLKEVEARLAKTRMHSAPEKEEHGRSIKKAAKAVGLDSRTAEKGLVVISEIDEAVAAGDEVRAEDLRKTLNKSVSKAHKKVISQREGVLDELKVPVPKSLTATFENSRKLRGLLYKIGEVRAIAEVVSTEDGGQLLPLRQIQADCTNVSSSITASRPHAVCPVCKGNGCDLCDDLGWMHLDQFKALPKGLQGGSE